MNDSPQRNSALWTIAMHTSDTSGWLRPLLADRLTPFPEIDTVRLQRNLQQQMQHKADQAGVVLRPHVKKHKNGWIAEQQRRLGARGITVSKPAEGIAFIIGVRDLLLALWYASFPITAAQSNHFVLRYADGSAEEQPVDACGCFT